ncbi:MAG: RNA-guided endonuclease InsQ/TnpB family protein [Nitrososphaerales archaeon]
MGYILIILNACEVACSILKNYRRCNRKPYAQKLMLKLDNQSYKIDGNVIRIPIKPREFITIPLRLRDYHKAFLEDESLKRGSITLTASIIAIAFSKTAIEVIEPIGVLGIDCNERSIDLASKEGFIKKIDVKAIPTIQHEYRAKRSRIQKLNSHNLRKCKNLLSKLKGRQTKRIEAILHKISKEIVQYAKSNKLAIVLEKLKGFRRSHQKGNGEGKAVRGRLNSWNYGSPQNFIDYKARWEGILVKYVSPRGTSSICSRCGCSLELKPKERIVRCSKCGLTIDRDANASLNIMNRGWYLCSATTA